MILLAFILILLGFVQFSMAINSHFQRLYGRGKTPAKRVWLFWLLASLYLLAGLVICIDIWRLSIGIVVWIGLLHLAAVAVAAMLTWQLRLFRYFWCYGCLSRLLLKDPVLP